MSGHRDTPRHLFTGTESPIPARTQAQSHLCTHAFTHTPTHPDIHRALGCMLGLVTMLAVRTPLPQLQLSPSSRAPPLQQSQCPSPVQRGLS